jgi:hypothetical protein
LWKEYQLPTVGMEKASMDYEANILKNYVLGYVVEDSENLRRKVDKFIRKI